MFDCILYAVLAPCAVTDIMYHRIPNRIVGWGMTVGFIWACVSGGKLVFCEAAGAGVWKLAFYGAAGAGLWKLAFCEAAGAGVWFLGRMALTAAVGFPFFVFRMVGAGDIKLMALITACLGMNRGVKSICIGFCLGAVLALGRMLRQGSICHRFIYLFAYIRRFIQSREIEPYYCPERDGYECVIPLGACLFAGVLVTAMWKG